MKLAPKQRICFWLLLGLTIFTVVWREAGGVNLDGVEPVILPHLHSVRLSSRTRLRQWIPRV